MKLTDIITKAQVLSGVGVFEGNTVDENLMAACLSIFHETLNDINNDPRATLIQKELNYQAYAENAAEPAPSAPGWVNAIPPIDAPAIPPALPETLFPGVSALPFPISREYPLPKDCRRVLKAFSNQAEFRKTDFSEIAKIRAAAAGAMNMYSVNGGSIQLARAAPAIIVYAKEFPEYMPQDDVDIPRFALPYLINLTAYNIALAFPSESRADMCRLMAEKSYNSLLANLAVNSGNKYINQFTAMNRLENMAAGSGL